MYSRTTKRCIVVRFKGVATRLNRRADCSQQTCRLGSARLLSLVTTFKKILPWTPKDICLYPKRYLLVLQKICSYPAAFSQSTRQKRSCGSLLTGIGYTSHSLSLDYDALKNIVESSENAGTVNSNGITLNEDFKFNSVKYQSYSASIGYAYNWVFLRNCLFSASLSAAVAYKNTKADVMKHNKVFEDFNFKNFNFDGIGRFGIVWNNDTWYAGANTILHTYNYKKSRFSSSSYFGSLNIYAGLNFGMKREYKKKK